MNQHAIVVTENNLEAIADLVDYLTVEDILEDCGHMLNMNIAPVLVVRILPTLETILDHIVPELMFYANARTTAPLNDMTFVKVVQL